jgi:oligopeptide transport system substrate-binding protein
MWTTGNGNNNTGWSNPQYDALVKDAYQAEDIKERYAYLNQAETVLLNDMPIIPLYWSTRIYIKHPSVKNWYPTLLDNRPLKHIYLEP